MDNVVSLYTSMEGRISRKTWWLASLALAVVVLIIEFVILTPLGFGPMANMAAIAAGGDPAATSAALVDGMHKAMWVSFIVYLVVAWPGIALGVKRRHDKDNGGMDVMVFWGLALVINLVGALGIGYSTMDMGNGIMIPAPSMPLTIINALFGIYAIYLLVVLGFLKGTTGSNQYGPDPLLAGAPAAA